MDLWGLLFKCALQSFTKVCTSRKNTIHLLLDTEIDVQCKYDCNLCYKGNVQFYLDIHK